VPTSKIEAAQLEKAGAGESNDSHVAVLPKFLPTIAKHAGNLDKADISAARQTDANRRRGRPTVANLALDILTKCFNVIVRVDNDWPARQCGRSHAVCKPLSWIVPRVEARYECRAER
jgi:hypothetical protein